MTSIVGAILAMLEQAGLTVESWEFKATAVGVVLAQLMKMTVDGVDLSGIVQVDDIAPISGDTVSAVIISIEQIDKRRWNLQFAIFPTGI